MSGKTALMAAELLARGGGRIAVPDARMFVRRAAQSGFSLPFLIDLADRTFLVTAVGDSWLDVVAPE